MAHSIQFERDENGANAPTETPRYAVRHFSVGEIASLWHLSEDYVRQLFENEPGVLVLGNTKSGRAKRRYRTLRVPEFVVERVHRKLSKV
jgi:hypothetical protein